MQTKETLDGIVKELLFLGLTKDDMRDIYKQFCDEYDMKTIEKHTKIRRKYGRNYG